MRKILVLEDEENIRSFVVINLKRATPPLRLAPERKLWQR